MSEFLWYSRLATWAGAVVLLAQAISNQGTSPLTFVGVVCLTLGFAGFLGGLVLEGRTSGQESNAQSPAGAEPEPAAPSGGPSKP